MGVNIPLIKGARHFAMSSVWGLVGSALPLVVGLFVLPPLVGALGVDRFGLLSFIWMLVGYFTIFDMGLSRAASKFVAADAHGTDDDRAGLAAIVGSSMAMGAAVGLAFGVVLVAVAPWLVLDVLKMPEALQDEALKSLAYTAALLPVVLVATVGFGCLEGMGRFRLLAAIRTPVGVAYFLVPLALTSFTLDVADHVLGLCAVRLVSCTVTVMYSLRQVRPVGRLLCLKAVRRIARYGLWVALSNLAGALIIQLDRLVIGITLGMSAMAYYAVPMDVLTKMWIVPGAIAGVLFPAVSALDEQSRNAHSVELVRLALEWTLIIVLIPSLAVIAFSHVLMEAWMGVDFAQHSSVVASLLALGILVNCLARVPFSWLQGVGPRVTAIIHVIELPFFAVALWMVAYRWGLAGVAAVWMLRIVIDSALFFYLSGRACPPMRRQMFWWCLVCVLSPALLVMMWHEAVALGVLALATATVLIWGIRLLSDLKKDMVR